MQHLKCSLSSAMMLVDREHGGKHLSRLCLYLTCLVMVFAIVGCASSSKSQYQPNTRIVDTLGAAGAKQQLQSLLSRSINPQVVETQVDDDAFEYKYRQAIAGIATGAILSNRVAFPNAVSLDVFNNNLVFIKTSANHLIAQFVFGNPEDAREFADIVASFHARSTTR